MTRHTVLAALLAGSISAPALAAGPPPLADWPTFLIARPAAIAVPAPPDAAATARELEALRGRSAERPADLVPRLRRWRAAGPDYLWNEAAVAALIARNMGNAPASRVLALLHTALYDVTLAVAVAREANPRQAPAIQDPSLAVAGVAVPASSYPSETAAVGAAANAVLAALIPAEAPRFAALAAEGVSLRQAAGLEWPSDAAAGAAIGEQVAALALARVRDDGWSRPWTGTVPTGPGRWVGREPAVPQFATMRPWVLPSADALRPAPPPAHDSPQTVAALAELKSYPRTPRSNADAVYWNVFGNARNFQLWNEFLSRRALEFGWADNAPRLAAAFAALAIAYYDSHIACWDGKYAYWYIRPYQLDPGLTTVVPIPPHPSYPAAHSCLSLAGTTVLEALFPADAALLRALSQQAGEARIAAGIHYRFDVEAGQEVGRRAAELALAKLAPALR